jgi:hypothetical protein
MKLSRSKVKSLCSANELELVDLSGPKNILVLSAAQLRLKVARARKLREKWQGQAQSQLRAKQQAKGGRSPSTDANSDAKAELFAEVLRRFESQLAKHGDSASVGSAPHKKPTPKTRGQKHRAARASVRDDLTQTRLEIAAKKRARRAAK